MNKWASYWIGKRVDHLCGSQLTLVRVKRLIIATTTGFVVGLSASILRLGSPEFLFFSCGWLGAVGGCVWTSIADWKK